RFVTHAKRLREDQTTQTNKQTADCRPPHPMNGQLVKRILGPVNEIREDCRDDAGGEACQRTEEETFRRNIRRMSRHREQWTKPKEITANHRGSGTGESNGNQASRFPFK